MKEKNFILKAILASVIFFGTGCVVYFIVNAALPSASTGDKLTATKRNNMITEVNSLRTKVTQLENIKRVDVDLNDTTSLFNTGCERRWAGNFYTILDVKLDGTMLIFDYPAAGSDSRARFCIKNTDKKSRILCNLNNSTLSSNVYAVEKLQKKCSN